MKWILSLIFVMVAAMARPITLIGNYIPAGGTYGGVTFQGPPANLAGTGTIQSVFEQALTTWNNNYLDDWTLTIAYGWSDSIGSSLASYYGSFFPFGGRHISGRVIFNPNYAWYADATPLDNSEWTTFTASEGNFGGGTMNTGRVYTNATGEAAGRFDMFTSALHEIGHGLSIGVGPMWTGEVADGFVNVTAPRSYVGSAIPIDPGQPQHLLADSSLMWYGGIPGQRRLISTMDQITGAQVSQFVQVVPEPGSILVLLTGVAFAMRKRYAKG